MQDIMSQQHFWNYVMLGYFGGNELQTRSVWLYIKIRTVSLIIYNIPKIQQGCCILWMYKPTIPCMIWKPEYPIILLVLHLRKWKTKQTKRKKKEWKNFLLLVSETIKVYSRSVVSYV